MRRITEKHSVACTQLICTNWSADRGVRSPRSSPSDPLRCRFHGNSVKTFLTLHAATQQRTAG
eukprot:6205786-Pleurochrysis_carterae.AAC.2